LEGAQEEKVSRPDKILTTFSFNFFFSETIGRGGNDGMDNGNFRYWVSRKEEIRGYGYLPNKATFARVRHKWKIGSQNRRR
jgi:hypothetical protein